MALVAQNHFSHRLTNWAWRLKLLPPVALPLATAIHKLVCFKPGGFIYLVIVASHHWWTYPSWVNQILLESQLNYILLESLREKQTENQVINELVAVTSTVDEFMSLRKGILPCCLSWACCSSIATHKFQYDRRGRGEILSLHFVTPYPAVFPCFLVRDCYRKHWYWVHRYCPHGFSGVINMP